jgi:hypothetical protein
MMDPPARPPRIGKQTHHRIAGAPLLLQGYEGTKQRGAITPAGEKRRLTKAGERVVCFSELTHEAEKARAWREKLSPAPGSK